MSLPSPVLSSSTGALNAVRSASSAKLGGSTQWSMSVLNSIQGEQPQQQQQQQAPAVDLENIGTFTHRANRKPVADSSEARASVKTAQLEEEEAYVPFRKWASWAAESVRQVQAEVDETRPTRIAERLRNLHVPRTPFEAPKVPHLLPVTHAMSRSKALQEWFIVDDASKQRKTRLSWYDPTARSIVPSNWFSEGLVGDLRHYCATPAAAK